MNIKLLLIYLVLFTNNIISDSRAVKSVYTKMGEENRIALVIGNSQYSYLNELRNPVNDSRIMRDILKEKGFNVIYLENATQIQIENAIENFASYLKSKKGIGLFYYAGHGIEVGGINYLIPINARISSQKFVKSKSVALEAIISTMEEARNRLNIIILDSCRANPFGRGNSGGLAPINSANGIYIAYATAPGKIAEDGSGNNGLFTTYLIKYIRQKGLKLEELFKKVRKDVAEETNYAQIPWSSSSIYGDFYFSLPTNNDNNMKINKPLISENIEPEKKMTYQKLQIPNLYKNKITIINNNMWQDDNENKRLDFLQSINYCKNLKLANFNDWRLPNREELNNLYHNKNKLKHSTSNYYWSSSMNKNTNYVSSIDFYAGGFYDRLKSTKMNVRCIR